MPGIGASITNRTELLMYIADSFIIKMHQNLSCLELMQVAAGYTNLNNIMWLFLIIIYVLKYAFSNLSLQVHIVVCNDHLG